MMRRHAYEFALHNGLPQPRWEAFYDTIESLTLKEQDAALTDMIQAWLVALAEAIGPEAGVLKSDGMFCLYSERPHEAESLLHWSLHALDRIITIVGDHRTPQMVGPRIMLLLNDLERYYDYIDYYYPDSGTFGASLGICVDQPYVHIAIGTANSQFLKPALAHELTHLALAPLSLPVWLDEGVAQMMEGQIGEASFFSIDRELRQSHRSLWHRIGLQSFWSGQSFNDNDDEVQELSYHLAEVLSRNILEDHRKTFGQFLAAARQHDAGEAAAREYLGRDLASFATQFLGEGAWEPSEVEVR